MTKRKKKLTALVALGGNSLIKTDQVGTIGQQEKNARRICGRLCSILERGYNLVLTHGNGPQVGNLLIRNEMAMNIVPAYPLDVLVASTEGSIGYILQQEFLNNMRKRNLSNYVVTMITQVMVDKNDPAFKNPTKPVGPFYTGAEARKIRKTTDWILKEISARRFRRVVPSPIPKKIIQRHMIRDLVHAGNVVIALGGGGVPMSKDRYNNYIGIEAVVDKDRASALLAREIKVDLFVFLTAVDAVYINYGKKNEKALGVVTFKEMEKYREDGHFPEGSMGPKVEGALSFIRSGGKEVIITNSSNFEKALDGKAGTRIVRKKTS